LGAFATYDAMSLFLLALATWLVTQPGERGEATGRMAAAGVALALANATAYSFLFMGLFGNNDETPANNATITSNFISGTADNIQIFGPLGVGNSYTAWKMKDQGAQRTIPGQTLTLTDDLGTAIQVSTNYWVSYDFNAATHRIWANYNNYVQAVYRGQMRVGLVTTVNSSGTGGTTGGLGDSGSGGSGSGNRKLPQM